MYIHQKNIITAGTSLEYATKAIVFIHGRGATADDIISLNDHLQVDDAALFAPQANHNSWYPYSFMVPAKENQPSLDSALEVIHELVTDIQAQGIPLNQLYFVGFSQGACLTLEYLARNAAQYGGAVAFTGGLIGKDINRENYSGNFKQTPILISTGDPDPHVPVSRVEESGNILEKMNANVQVKIYPGRQHTISRAEIDLARKLIFHL